MVSLGEFDLLRDGTTDLTSLPWTKEPVREAMRLYFGIKRAREEIKRLNVEIRRQVTYMFDEELLYSSVAKSPLARSNPLARHIFNERQYQAMIYCDVTWYLWKTSQLPNFSGDLSPGIRQGSAQNSGPDAPPAMWMSYLRGQVLNRQALEHKSIQVPLVSEEEENIVVNYFEHLSTNE
jgi:hypothetical protein